MKRILLFASLTTCIALAACGDLFVRSCDKGHHLVVNPWRNLSSPFYPADTITLVASYMRGERNNYGDNCGSLEFQSLGAPNRFVWLTSDSAILRVHRGIVTAVGPGVAKVRVFMDGYGDSLTMQVTPRP